MRSQMAVIDAALGRDSREYPGAFELDSLELVRVKPEQIQDRWRDLGGGYRGA